MRFVCPLQENQFRGVEYSAAVADFFVPDNLRPVAQWHPRITDVVYWGKQNKEVSLSLWLLAFNAFHVHMGTYWE